MRQIKASEVKPGMEIEFTITRRMTVREHFVRSAFRWEMADDTGGVAVIDPDTPVTVLSEPAPPQPEEPTELGVKARVRKGRFVRLHEGLAGSNVWFEEGTGYRWTWDELCEMGPVTVIPDQGWTVPDAPVVPERVEEWPEDDTELRKHKWRDAVGDVWVPVDDRWGWGDKPWGSHDRPACGPWTRDFDA